MFKPWTQKCVVDADIEIFYKGSRITHLTVNRLKVTEVGNKKKRVVKDGSLSKGGISEDLAVE